jgi:methylated-DNA-[protein]-cysteine S-methyltransferase
MTSTTQAAHAACVAQLTVPSPLGPVLLARSRQGLCGAWFDGQKHHPGPLSAPVAASDSLLLRAARQLADYFAGRRSVFDLPFDPQGSAFQRRVWQALIDVQPGHTTSYGQIALTIEAPQAVRAVGAAVGKNPLSIFIPCHRIVGGDGALTGYAGGLGRKQALLELEGAPGFQAGLFTGGAGGGSGFAAEAAPTGRVDDSGGW